MWSSFLQTEGEPFAGGAAVTMLMQAGRGPRERSSRSGEPGQLTAQAGTGYFLQAPGPQGGGAGANRTPDPSPDPCTGFLVVAAIF